MRTTSSRRASVLAALVLCTLALLFVALESASDERADGNAPADAKETHPGQERTNVPVLAEGPENKTLRLSQLAWRLRFMAQNLHRDAERIEAQFFDEAIEAFSRLGIAEDSETGDILVYITGALAYAPAEILDKNPDHFTVTDPENPFRITSAELKDPERIAEAKRMIEASKTAAPEGAFRAELSPAAHERLVDLMVLFERVLMRQAAWLSNHWKTEGIGKNEMTIASRLLFYITGIDGWSSGYGYLPRAHAVALNYFYFNMDVAGRRNGRFDTERRRQLENELAGMELAAEASAALKELVAKTLRQAWLASQKEIRPEERIFIAQPEAETAVQALLPRRVDKQGTVTFFPGSEGEKVYESFDFEAYREGALEWRALADLMWQQGAWDLAQLTGSKGKAKRDLLPLEHYAADQLGDLAAHFTVLLLATAGEEARAAGEAQLGAARLAATTEAILRQARAGDKGTVAPPPAQAFLFTEVGAKAGIVGIENPLVTDKPGASGPSLMAHDAFRGVATADFDRDGRPDLFLAEERGDSRLYRNLGDGSFQDVTSTAGLTGLERVSGGYFADVNNDGCADLLILRNHLSSLFFENRCDGTFAERTREAGLYRDGLPSTGIIWLDYDNDGLLDLYHLTTGRFDRGFVPSRGDYQNAEANVLFRNKGDGTFEDVTAQAGVDDRGIGLAAATIDFDNDGDQDIYIANDMQRNVLYENVGGRFRDIAREAGVDDIGNGMGVSIGDVDSDGWMDMYLTNISAPPPPQFAESAQSNRLFLNKGDGTFEDVHKARLGSHITGWGWNSFFFDFNNDGHLDVYIINGFRPEFQPHNAESNFLFRADPAGGGYQNVSAESGVDYKSYSRGGIYFDYDADGDLDVVLTGLHSPLLFRNDSQGPNRNWIAFDMVGQRSTRDGYGAKIKVTSGERVQVTEVGNQGGNFISSIHGPIHFGLGAANKADKVEVRWPSGAVQTLTGLEAGRRHVITEPAAN